MSPEQDCSQRLPDTCPISQTELSQLTCGTQDAQQPWGRLYPIKPEFQSLDFLKEIRNWLSDTNKLIRDEYTLGRGPHCDRALLCESDNRGKESRIHGTISKVHFKIRRTRISSPDFDDFIVHLDDLSSNGTFVNGEKVGKGNSVILENHNEISLCFSYYKAFIYVSSSLDSEVRTYPEEVKVKYAISRVLGTGSFGKVRLVFEKTSGQALAMKIIQKKRFCNEARHVYDPVRTQREVDILKALSHEFIIKFVNVINSNNHVFIITEYMEGGELFDRVKNGPLPESDAKLYFTQLALAVRYLHDNDIIHRDIKLENILLSSKGPECRIKLSDFGFSKFLDQESVLMTFCGTPLYIAPEILRNKGKPGSYDKKVDIWSMGVVLFICLSGVPPFQSSEGHQLTRQILRGLYSFSHRNWGSVTRKAIYLVKRMLTLRPRERISTEGVLNHEWLQDRSVRMRVNRLLKNSTSQETPPEKNSDSESDAENQRTAKRTRVEN